MIITVKHVRACGMCLIPGAKQFFERNNLDWKTFVREGLDEELILATGDTMARIVVEFANGQQEKTDDRV